MLTDVSLLVVEDDRDTLDLFASSLTKVGASVRTAASADAALEVLATYRPHVILCDLHMPDVDGYMFLARVREIPALRAIPVIAISASHPTIEHSKALEAGFAMHLTKPSKLGDVLHAIKDVLAGAPARRAIAADR